MDRETYEHLTQRKPERIFYYEVSHVPGTLLYGYDCDRHTWHVFNSDKGITLHVYNGEGTLVLETYDEIDGDLLLPNKRLYPECCNGWFCQLLQDRGINVAERFTVYTDRDPSTIYAGGYWGCTKSLNNKYAFHVVWKFDYEMVGESGVLDFSYVGLVKDFKLELKLFLKRYRVDVHNPDEGVHSSQVVRDYWRIAFNEDELIMNGTIQTKYLTATCKEI